MLFYWKMLSFRAQRGDLRGSPSQQTLQAQIKYAMLRTALRYVGKQARHLRVGFPGAICRVICRMTGGAGGGTSRAAEIRLEEARGKKGCNPQRVRRQT
jgi:hypothetical protein